MFQNAKAWLCLKCLVVSFTWDTEIWITWHFEEVSWLQTIAVGSVSWVIPAIQWWGAMEKKRQVKAGGKGPQSLKGKEEEVRIFEPETVNH